MTMSQTKISLSKFKGCLLGGLIGDCFGAMYEGRAVVIPVDIILERMNCIVDGKPKPKDKLMAYTDDSAMTMGLCQSLLACRGLELTHLAKTFSKNFFKDPNRGYGPSAFSLYDELEKGEYKDVLAPAAAIFDGSGSYGNGGAMRIAPMALYAANHDCDNAEKLIKLSQDATRVTHTNPKGLAGAVLQCLAVHTALNSDATADPKAFIGKLRRKMTEVDGAEDYLKQFDLMEEQLGVGKKVDPEWVVRHLGRHISAPKSVGTALFSCLRSLSPVESITTDNPFVRCIVVAVMFGGDTDTIACMAGAIAGALHGVEAIPTHLADACEAKDEVLDYAEQLYKLAYAEPEKA